MRAIPALKNAVVDLCIENFRAALIMPAPRAVAKVRKKCLEGDAMRQLLIDFVTKTNPSQWGSVNPKSQTFFPDVTRDSVP